MLKENLTLKVRVSGGEVFGRQLDHGSSHLLNGSSALLKGSSENILILLHCEDKNEKPNACELEAPCSSLTLAGS